MANEEYAQADGNRSAAATGGSPNFTLADEPDTEEKAGTLPLISRPIAPPKKGGFIYHWGPQAWVDMVMSYNMLVKKGTLTIVYTFLPILRMTTDRDRIDREWAEMQAREEKVNFFDSPRERWRKNYGNLVRNMEWILLELRQHFSHEQYEEIVVGTTADLAKANSAGFLEMMKGMADTDPKKGTTRSEGTNEPGRLQKILFEMFNPAGFLTGPAEMKEFDPAAGKATMYVPDCAWHVCAAAKSLPNPNALPEQGCLLICKGAFERLFDGEGGGLKMDFEPHLPQTSCTVEMTWKTPANQ
jgi:hypothetical protein